VLDAVICSPPYSETRVESDIQRRAQSMKVRIQEVNEVGYGLSPGQLGGLPVGDLDAVLTSPPYAASLGQPDGVGHCDLKKCADGRVRRPTPGSQGSRSESYGFTPGQVGALRAEDYPVRQQAACEELVWQGCYDKGWGDLLPRAAYAHPAKYAYGLICRVVRFGLERGLWAPGDLIGDPFAGVGCGGLACAYEGLRWVGVELEGKFVGLAREVFARHRRAWEALGAPQPLVLQGDSRRFAEAVGAAQAVLTSPPWAECDVDRGQSKVDFESKRQAARGRDPNGAGHLGSCASYGATPGQVGALPAGGLDGVLTSPPYLETTNHKKESPSRQRLEAGASPGAMDCRYGKSPGQVGVTGDLSCNPTCATCGGRKRGTAKRCGCAEPDWRFRGEPLGETYWQAVRQIYGQCLLALKPGGTLCVTVKSYVKGGKLIDLPAQTEALLEYLGFRVFLRVKASLVKETREPGLFEPEVVRVKKRVSFFRRLAEKRGSPAVDHECVLFARAPA
jgi:hypothetical protein